MGTLAFYELPDESAYIAVFLVTSHNTVRRGNLSYEKWRLYNFISLLKSFYLIEISQQFHMQLLFYFHQNKIRISFIGQKTGLDRNFFFLTT